MKRKKKVILFAWFFLVCAIVIEAVGVSILKINNTMAVYVGMMIAIGLSYYFLSLAIRRIQIGVAYAVWELLGSVIILSISFFVFDEVLSQKQLLGIFISFIGIILISLGEVKQK